MNNFHTCCPYSKRKKCFCSIFKPNKFESSLSDFIQNLYNGKYEIDTSGKQINIVKNISKGENDLIKAEENLIKEQIHITNYHDLDEYFTHLNEHQLNLNDYKDIQKSINEDKKVCEKCGVNLYNDNYHKGWKKDDGEYVLLCYSCSKKYFSGANEVKYENKREESYNSNNSVKNTYNNNILIPPPIQGNGFNSNPKNVFRLNVVN